MTRFRAIVLFVMGVLRPRCPACDTGRVVCVRAAKNAAGEPVRAYRCECGENFVAWIT